MYTIVYSCATTGASVEMVQSKIGGVLSTLSESHHLSITTEYNVSIIYRVYSVGMGDIDILAYNYCEASISRLSRLLN